MRMRHTFAALAFAGALALCSATPAHAQNARAKPLGDKIMCMCGGCNDAAGKCTHSGGAFAGPCAFAQKELKEVDERISNGSSDDLILQSFVQEYGPTVLISPPARGFDLWAWLMPVLALLIGLLLAFSVVFHWRRRASVPPAARISPEILSRVRHDTGAGKDD